MLNKSHSIEWLFILEVNSGVIDEFMHWNSLIVGVFGVGIFGIVARMTNRIADAYKAKKKAEVEAARIKAEAEEKKSEQMETRFQNIESGMVAMLHSRIYKTCSEYLEIGWISVDDLDDLDYLFCSYKGLGGNGTGEVIYNKVKALPNKKEVNK